MAPSRERRPAGRDDAQENASPSRRVSGVLQPLDDAARRLAQRLVRASRHGALATCDAEDGTPLASRVLVASDAHGGPLLLVSRLAAHSAALDVHPSCSILFGEIEQGDPLASPRISVFGVAEPLDGDRRAAARGRFIARHPAAALYCDFADFRFLAVRLTGASLIAGFARAYRLATSDLIDPPRSDLDEGLRRAANHMNADHGSAVDAIAHRRAGGSGAGWRIVTADPSGFEVALGDELRRVFFAEPVEAPDQIRQAFVALAQDR